jgi:hypothetical protein
MARQALVRLRQRTRNRPGEAESYAGLVQVLRFCGLLDESIEAHNRVHDLDPTMGTSVAHTMFLLGDYGATIESYGGRTGYYLDAASWAALGETGRTQTLLRGRLEQSSLSGWMAGLMKSLLAIVEQRNDEALREMETVRIVHEPEALVYMARQYAFLGAGDQALRTLRQAVDCGFVCAPQTLRSDPWFRVLREHAGYKALLTEAESLVSEARRAQ